MGKIVCGLVCILGYGLIHIALFTDTDIGSYVIEVVQGRYFLPFIPLVLLCVTKKINIDKKSILEKTSMSWFCILSILEVYYLLRVFLL